MSTSRTLRLLPLLCILFGCTKQQIIPENKVPTADGGVAMFVTLPTDTVTLKGSGTDADGQVVAYLWSQVSGPATAVISTPGASSTLIKSSTAGRYIFQLMVTDNKGATGVDTTSVTVNPPVIKTLTIQPTNNGGEVELAIANGQDQSGTGSADLHIAAWTKNGGAYNIREVLNFNFSPIPYTATIVSANLYLYSYPPPTLTGNGQDANFGTNNALLLQQITVPWASYLINWNSQPSVSTSNQIVIPSTTQSVLDLNIDVTDMVGSMIRTGGVYGFMLRLQNEQMYTSRIFVSSYNTVYPAKHPKLVIQYR